MKSLTNIQVQYLILRTIYLKLNFKPRLLPSSSPPPLLTPASATTVVNTPGPAQSATASLPPATVADPFTSSARDRPNPSQALLTDLESPDTHGAVPLMLAAQSGASARGRSRNARLRPMPMPTTDMEVTVRNAEFIIMFSLQRNNTKYTRMFEPS